MKPLTDAKPVRYVVIFLFNVTTAWLQMDPAARKEFRDRCFGPVFDKYRERVRPRILDAWSFTSRFTDVLQLETADLSAYRELMNELRETELFSGEFIERVETIVTVEDAFLG